MPVVLLRVYLSISLPKCGLVNLKIMKYTQEKFREIINYWMEICPDQNTMEIISPPHVMKSNAGYYVGRTCYDEGCNATVPYDRITKYYTDKAEAVKILGKVKAKECLDDNMWDAGYWDNAVFAEIIYPNK